MASIEQLFARLKKQEDEIRALRGMIQRIAVGGQVITPIPGTASVPDPVANAVIVGNSTPAWERSVPAPTTGQTLVLTSTDVTPKPHWAFPAAVGQYRMFTYTVDPGPPTFTFIVDGGGNPVFVLLDLE